MILKLLPVATMSFDIPCTENERMLLGGSVAEWFRLLGLKSGGPWFKSSTLLLSGFVLGSLEFNPSTALCK